MKVNILKLFVELVKIGSYSDVADKFDKTQPYVTMQIKSLEKHFSSQLVVKKSGKIFLTPSGRILYNTAKIILDEWDIAENKIKKLKDVIFDSFKIGASTIPSLYLLPKKLKIFSQKFTGIKILLETADSKEILDKIEKNQIDVGLIGIKPKNNKLKAVPIAKDSMVLIVPNNIFLAEKRKVTLQDIIMHQIILREEGSGTRKTLINGLQKAGIKIPELNIISVMNSTEGVIAAVEEGLGISFVSSLAANKAVSYNRIKKVNVEDLDINRYLYLVYNKLREKEMLIKEFYKIF